MTVKAEYQRRDFYGTVVMKDWMSSLEHGEVYRMFTGKVSILADTEIVGFESKGNGNANWVARVEGPTQAYNILGCQIRAVIAHGPVDLVSHEKDRLIVP